ncbi:hypothetical protein KY343_02770 [Candidatus Woesearchaeota archaeon]|nr:hypothetical protein [Candidatus Woesearchaeota archaeon]
MKKKKSYRREKKNLAELNTKEKMDKLQVTLDHIEKELEENVNYIQNELPKKWYSEEKLKKREEEKPVEKTEKVTSKKELERLQKISSYIEKKLNRNIDYLQKDIPKSLPSGSDKLIKERKKVLAEITATRKLIESLEKERIKLEKEVFEKEAEEQTAELKQFEESVGEKLSKNVNMFKAKKKKKEIQKKSKKKIPAIKPKVKISEQELAKLQASLDKLNKELELVK